MKFFQVAALLLTQTDACTNILVTRGASTEETNMVSYNADSASLYGSLYHYPATRENAESMMRDVYEWDTGKYLGKIPEVSNTHNVVGNVNEVGLSISETTFGGVESLCSQSKAIIDYGSLIYLTLQRASNAREAVHTMDQLMQDYGYYSEGESFSIADDKEIWIMEVIGKGENEKGSVWVARKIPDGMVSSHANQARITTFPKNDPDTALYAHDVIDFARDYGLYDDTDDDDNFSFSDTYDPVTFEGARFCEGRVWSFFSSVLGTEFEHEYLDYVSGHNLTNRMPLFVTPPEKISLSDVFGHMRNHFEETGLDFRGDSGAGQYNLPYRFRPLTWAVDSQPNKTYVNERSIGTQQTGWNYVAQIRPAMPKELQALLWFGVDDSATTVRFPVYGSATRLPASFEGKGAQDGVVPPMMSFDLKQAFYVFNLAANWAYSRWSDIYPVMLEQIVAEESQFQVAAQKMDAVALAAMKTDKKQAIELISDFGIEMGDGLTQRWFEFFGQLFVRFRDGYDITEKEGDPECGCEVGGDGYPSQTYERIVAETGDHYLDVGGGGGDHLTDVKDHHKVKSKLSLRAFK